MINLLKKNNNNYEGVYQYSHFRLQHGLLFAPFHEEALLRIGPAAWAFPFSWFLNEPLGP